MPADYIMRKEPDARRAFLKIRSNLGLSHEEAVLRIERAFDANFRTLLLSDEDLTDEETRGFTVEKIFPNLEELGMIRRSAN